jgi:predicted GIY-YIG superfamily endonuclease
MPKKTVDNNKTSIEKLPDNKPILYKIKTESGNTNYIGIAQRGRVQERLKEHLSGQKDYIPGATVQLEQFNSINQARKKETEIIKKNKPKYNK